MSVKETIQELKSQLWGNPNFLQLAGLFLLFVGSLLRPLLGASGRASVVSWFPLGLLISWLLPGVSSFSVPFEHPPGVSEFSAFS